MRVSKCLDSNLILSDAPTSAPAWQFPLLAPGQTDRQTPEPMLPVQGQTEETHAQKGFTVSSGKFLSSHF